MKTAKERAEELASKVFEKGNAGWIHRRNCILLGFDLATEMLESKDCLDRVDCSSPADFLKSNRGDVTPDRSGE